MSISCRHTPENLHDNKTTTFLLGDTSSNACFSIVMLAFWGVDIQLPVIYIQSSLRCTVIFFFTAVGHLRMFSNGGGPGLCLSFLVAGDFGGSPLVC